MRSFITCMLHQYNNEVKECEIVGHVACMGEMKNTYKILIRKPEGKRPLSGHRSRGEDNVRIYIGEVCDGVD
jgi:hypothetical protein